MRLRPGRRDCGVLLVAVNLSGGRREVKIAGSWADVGKVQGLGALRGELDSLPQRSAALAPAPKCISLCATTINSWQPIINTGGIFVNAGMPHIARGGG